MPKKQPKNALFFYMLHFQDKDRKTGRIIIQVDLSKYRQLNRGRRRMHNNADHLKRKHWKQDLIRSKWRKFTSQGIPLHVIEKEQKQMGNEHRTMIRTIKELV